MDQPIISRRVDRLNQARAARPPENYADMVKRLFKEMESPAATLIHAAVGMTGEAAELLKAKILADEMNQQEELGDFRFYLQKLLLTFGWTMGSFNGVDVQHQGNDPMSSLIIECGEVQDLLKKSWVYGKEMDDKAVLALFDRTAVMVDAYHGLIGELGLTDDDVQAENQYKLVSGPNARFPRGYTDAAAIARADKVEQDMSTDGGCLAAADAAREEGFVGTNVVIDGQTVQA